MSKDEMVIINSLTVKCCGCGWVHTFFYENSPPEIVYCPYCGKNKTIKLKDKGIDK